MGESWRCAEKDAGKGEGLARSETLPVPGVGLRRLPSFRERQNPPFPHATSVRQLTSTTSESTVAVRRPPRLLLFPTASRQTSQLCPPPHHTTRVRQPSPVSGPSSGVRDMQVRPVDLTTSVVHTRWHEFFRMG